MVRHFNIQDYLRDDTETIKRRALKIMLPLLSYRQAQNSTDIPSIKVHCVNKFCDKNMNNYKLSELLIR